MKNIITILLALAVLLSFSACSFITKQEDIRGDQIVNDGSSSSTEQEFSLGEAKGLTYENKFIGIGCTLDSDWTFYTDEQIKELNNISSDVAGDDLKEILENASIVYDMAAGRSNGLDNINVNLEKMNAITLAALDLAENYETAYSLVEESYVNMGYTDISHEITTAKIDGEDHTALRITAEINGMKLYQKLISIKCSGYLANITVSTYEEDTVDAILDKFYTVK